MYKLKRIGVMSLAVMTATIYGIFGLVFGVLFALMGGAMGGMMGNNNALGMGAALGIFAIIALPIGYAVMGFIGGALAGVIYNFVAQKVGGVELYLEQGSIASTTPVANK